MNMKHKTILLFTMGSFLLVSCGPNKNEEKKVEPKQVEQKAAKPLKESAPQPTEKKHKEGLTPEQKMKLNIDEDEVFDTVPG